MIDRVKRLFWNEDRREAEMRRRVHELVQNREKDEEPSDDKLSMMREKAELDARIDSIIRGRRIRQHFDMREHANGESR